MGIRVTAATITVGTAQQLEISQGEDREFRLTFNQDGGVLDFTGARSIRLAVKSRTTGAEIFSREYSGFQGLASEGTPRFRLLASDTAIVVDGPYDCDVRWDDVDGLESQILVLSTFLLLRGVGQSGDVVTSPPAVPVVYGLNWLGSWSTPTGGYNPNDAVTAQDGSLGATSVSSFRSIAAGVTVYPINASLFPASGWAYVGQHGGGSGGSSGPPFTGTSAHGTFVLSPSQTGSDPDHDNFWAYTPAEVGAQTWRAWAEQFDNPGGGTKNQTMAMGWGIGEGSAPYLAGTAAIWDAWESTFNSSYGRQGERHVEFVDNNGVLTRFLSALAPHDGSTTTLNLQADQVLLGGYTSGPRASSFTARFGATSAAIFTGEIPPVEFFLDATNSYIRKAADAGVFVYATGEAHLYASTSGSVGRANASQYSWDVNGSRIYAPDGSSTVWAANGSTAIHSSPDQSSVIQATNGSLISMIVSSGGTQSRLNFDSTPIAYFTMGGKLRLAVDSTGAALWGDLATSGATTKPSSPLTFKGWWWNGASTVATDATIRHVVDSTSPTGHFGFGFNSATDVASLYDTGVLGLSVASGNTAALSLKNGASAAVSASGEVMMRSNAGAFEVSANGGAYASFLPLAGGTMSGAITFSGTQLGTYTLGGTPTLGAALAITTDSTNIGSATKRINPFVLSINSGASSMTLTSAVADGATAVGHIFDTTNSLVTAGAKHISFRNAGTEQLNLLVGAGGATFTSSGAIVFARTGSTGTFTVSPSGGEVQVGNMLFLKPTGGTIAQLGGFGGYEWATTWSIQYASKAQAIAWSTATPATPSLTGGEQITITLSINVTAWALPAGTGPRQTIVVVFVQDGTGSRTLAGAGSTVKLQSVLTLSTGAGKRDSVAFMWDGVNWIELNRSLNN